MRSIPVTDAFDRQDSMEELEATLPPDQIEWLRQVAEARDVSVGHVIRTILTACIRKEESSSTDSEDERATGDGVPPSFAEEANEQSASGTSSEDSLLNRLRSTAEQLDESSPKELEEESYQVEQERGTDEQKRADGEGEERASERSKEASSDAGSIGAEERSMFDMV